MIRRKNLVRLRKSFLISASIILCALGFSLIAQIAAAMPQGARTVEGRVSVGVSDDGRSMTIEQHRNKPNRAIVNWDSFGTAADESVTIRQPNARSLLINRVTGGSASVLDGSLTANGDVMIINENGVLFGRGSTTDVNGLIATTIDIPDADLMNRDVLASRESRNADGTVINEGSITARGGLAALVAPGVVNAGVITARTGRVALASGSKYTLDLYGDGLVQLAPGAESLRAVRRPDGSTLESMVTNSGTIEADGGSVLLTARAAAGVVDDVVDMSGVVRARGLSSRKGSIVLHGGDANAVAVSGTLDVSNGGGAGGEIRVLGEHVALRGAAVLDASGASGGGRIYVGGNEADLPDDRTGAGGVKMAVSTFVGRGVDLDVSGGSGVPGLAHVTGYSAYYEGSLPIVVTSLHGGRLKPTYLDDRDCSSWTGDGACVLVGDSKTQEIAEKMLETFEQMTGEKAHYVVVNLHRSKLDANRELDGADGTGPEAMKTHGITHGFIEQASLIISKEHGRGLLVDIHGTAHDRKAIELGYGLYSSILEKSDDDLDARYVDRSTIRSLGYDNSGGQPFSKVLRGVDSLGGLLERRVDAEGNPYVAVPSPSNPSPGGHPYFSGGYTVQRHGSAAEAGTALKRIDAIQMEATQHYRTLGGETVAKSIRDKFSEDFAGAVLEFMDLHYPAALSDQLIYESIGTGIYDTTEVAEPTSGTGESE